MTLLRKLEIQGSMHCRRFCLKHAKTHDQKETILTFDMHHADERLNYKYVLIDVETLNYVLNRFFEQIMIIGSVDTVVSIYGSFWCFTN